jgi:hypothetical protein
VNRGHIRSIEGSVSQYDVSANTIVAAICTHSET